jgi:small-conductance mechanosensitive channel
VQNFLADLDLYLLVPIVLLLAGYALGALLERVVTLRLRRLAERSSSHFDDVLLQSLKGVVTAGFALLGFYGAIITLRVNPTVSGYLQKTLLIATIAYGTVVTARLAVGYVNLYAAKMRGTLPSTSIFSNLTRAAIYIIGLLVILATEGVSISPILATLGVGGLAVALALQDTLSNLFSGLQLIGSRQVRPGDFIQLDSGEEGYVVDITWRNTSIREPSNNTVIVPNSRLASSRVRNYYQPDRELSVAVKVGVSYESNLEAVERVTMEVARDVVRTVPGGVPDAEPVVLYTAFADASIDFVVVLRGKEASYRAALTHAFIKQLHERYLQEGIEIPFAPRAVYTKKKA